jgi:hypothetical protein
MSDYTKLTDFLAKDALTSGDPEKIVLGADLDAEFNAISTAIGTKADTSDFNTIANIDYTHVSAQHTKSKATQEYTLTDGATITIDCTQSNVFQVTLGGNRTMAAPTSPLRGQVINLIIRQDATGSRTITWNSVFTWPGGTAPTLTTTANGVDVITMAYDYAATKWRCVANLAFS